MARNSRSGWIIRQAKRQPRKPNPDPAPRHTRFGLACLPDQSRTAAVLNRLHTQNRLPHALLFAGDAGSGRFTAALTLMMARNCREEQAQSALAPCGTCRSCRKILSEAHPDFHVIRPKTGQIRIDSIRDLMERLVRKPHEARERFVILQDADCMNPEASNALLKLLEEPPSGTFFILISSLADVLLQTIRSRCQELRFQPVSKETLMQCIRKLTTDTDVIETASRMGCGSVTLASAHATEEATHRRRTLCALVAALPLAGSGERMAAAEWMAQDKDTALEMLDLLEFLFRDVLVAGAGEAWLFLKDCQEDVQRLAASCSAKAVLLLIASVRKTRRRIRQNAAHRLAMEALLMEIRGVDP